MQPLVSATLCPVTSVSSVESPGHLLLKGSQAVLHKPW